MVPLAAQTDDDIHAGDLCPFGGIGDLGDDQFIRGRIGQALLVLPIEMGVVVGIGVEIALFLSLLWRRSWHSLKNT